MEKQTTQEYEKAIAYIIDRIKEGSLQLGSKLPPERRIAEELGIGRNSIREAISILHGMGLIERRLIKIKITPLIIPATILPTQATTPMYLQRMSHY